MSQQEPDIPAGNRVGHLIEIAAPASAVWQRLADLAGWGAWNPLYVQASGRPAAGEAISFTVVVPGMKPMKGMATVVSVSPEHWLHYEIVNAGGLIRAYRQIGLEALGPDRCRVTNTETMSGLLGRLLGKAVGGRVRQGLQAMNEALKRQVEGSHRALDESPLF